MNRKRTTVSRLLRCMLPAGIAVMAWTFSGCEGWGTDPDDELSAEELAAVLEELVFADEAVSIDGLEDADYQEDVSDVTANTSPAVSSLAKAVADTVWSSWDAGVKWRRRITDRSRYFKMDIVAADTAYGTITRVLTGSLRLAFWTRDSLGEKVITDSLDKSLEIETTRRIRFVKSGNPADSRRGWRVAGMTAVLGTAGDKVSVQSLSFVTPDTTIGISREEVLNHFFVRAELPRFQPLDTLQCYAQVDNLGPVFPWASGEKVIVRRVGRIGTQGFTNRARLRDDGRGVDQTIRDNIFSGSFLVNPKPDKPRTYRLFVEVKDLASYFVTMEDYHCEFIGLPYLVDDAVQ